MYWLIAAAGAKRGHHAGGTGPRGALLITAFVLLRVFEVNDLAVDNPIVQATGVTLLVLGLGLAAWARISSVATGGCR